MRLQLELVRRILILSVALDYIVGIHACFKAFDDETRYTLFVGRSVI
jgi:hypothetical protein